MGAQEEDKAVADIELFRMAKAWMAATIASPDYGPNSERLMTYDDVQAQLGIRRDDQKLVVQYMTRFGVSAYTDRGQNNGIYVPKGDTVMTLYDRVFGQILDKAIRSLTPHSEKMAGKKE